VVGALVDYRGRIEASQGASSKLNSKRLNHLTNTGWLSYHEELA
jgi:hypothetical protein